jgi:AmpE protein
MSLLSILLALMAEKKLHSTAWQFDSYYQRYLRWLSRKFDAKGLLQGTFSAILTILLPVLITTLLIDIVDDSFFEFLLSTLILTICFGCAQARAAYKCFLDAAFRGEITTCELNRQQLIQQKNLAEQGFGQALIWLNYRYYIAIILFFLLFGAPGALFYRLLTALVEHAHKEDILVSKKVNALAEKTLAAIDWLPVRITAFGYMLVGHFSNALTTWVESLFDFENSPNKTLISVAEVAEDFLVDEEDCAAEPCLLVRLAKRNLLLLLSVIALLTLIGVLH